PEPDVKVVHEIGVRYRGVVRRIRHDDVHLSDRGVLRALAQHPGCGHTAARTKEVANDKGHPLECARVPSCRIAERINFSEIPHDWKRKPYKSALYILTDFVPSRDMTAAVRKLIKHRGEITGRTFHPVGGITE